MSDLDLTAAIEAAAKAMWDHQFEDGHWDEVGSQTGDNAEHCRNHAEHGIRAALPHIERAVREQAAQELMPGEEATSDGQE